MDNNKTSRKLLRAYAMLLKKDVQRISVSMLCEKADVARATFYIYYKGIDEFTEQLHNYIIRKFFEQATKLLGCSDEELEVAVKKENLLLDEDELIILRHMISGTNYINFAFLADIYYVNEKDSSLFSQEEWKKHRDELDVFSRGYLPILILNLTEYDEKKFKSDMQNCRNLFQILRVHILLI